MPHISIKHFPVPLTERAEQAISAEITETICRHLGADSNAVSIALQPVAAENWNDTVLTPEIRGTQQAFLIKQPGY